MTTGICLLSCIPVRSDPSEKSEMVSQLLFGETFQITGEKEGWMMISSDADSYSGWVTRKMIRPLSDGYDKDCRHVISQPFTRCIRQPGNIMFLPGGSMLPALSDGSFVLADELYDLQDKSAIDTTADIATLAEQYLGAPYLWGGKTVFGIDCSGLVQVVFRMTGLWMPRDAWQQEQTGEKITYGQGLRGDLAFFGNTAGKVIHVGILTGPDTVIHASGKVRIDRLDHNGIFNQEEQLYSHQLYSLKRIKTNK